MGFIVTVNECYSVSRGLLPLCVKEGLIYHIMILVFFTVGSTSSGSAFVIVANLGAKTIFESISL